MSNKFYTLLSATTAIGLCSVANAAEARGAQRERCVAVTEDQVNAQFARFNDAFQTRNPDTVTALFSENATLLPTVSGRMRTDVAGIRDYFVSFLRGQPVGTVTESETSVGCNIATRAGNWTVRLTNAETGATSDVSARFTFVYIYENRDWRIFHLHSSLRPAT